MKIHDTRIHHLYEKNYILREFRISERPIPELQEVKRNQTTQYPFFFQTISVVVVFWLLFYLFPWVYFWEGH